MLSSSSLAHFLPHHTSQSHSKLAISFPMLSVLSYKVGYWGGEACWRWCDGSGQKVDIGRAACGGKHCIVDDLGYFHSSVLGMNPTRKAHTRINPTVLEWSSKTTRKVLYMCGCCKLSMFSVVLRAASNVQRWVNLLGDLVWSRVLQKYSYITYVWLTSQSFLSDLRWL